MHISLKNVKVSMSGIQHVEMKVKDMSAMQF